MSERPVQEPLAGHRPVLEAELREIRDAVMELTRQVEVAIERAVWALRTRNPDLCTAVIEADAVINEQHRRIRDKCFHVILTQAPVAGDLRHILGFEHMASELERMGDHCVSIARIARSTVDLPDTPTSEPLAALAEQTQAQVRDMLAAVENRDMLTARDVARRDSVVDMQYRHILSSYMDEMTADGSLAPRATGLVFVAHYLERIADRVTNVAEELIFAESGGVEDLG
jgi:phosphate transport system protein